MMQKWQVLSITVLILITGHSCYIGPEFKTWDLDENNASAKIGMPLFIVPDVPAAGWEPYTATQNIQNLADGYYRVFESSWTDRQKEWVIYRRIGNSYSYFRIFTNGITKLDFDTITEVEGETGSLSEVSWTARNANVIPSLAKNYRVYDCLWRNGLREWIIINETSPDNYQWGRKPH
ncbi:MAG: hypothetical protein FWG89_11030 [Treponema sp.]|nr:hypothetical protein [Treponema sp.]